MNKKADDSGVSDIIGVMLMISIVVISLGIIGTFLFSMITVQSIPQVDLQVSKIPDTGTNCLMIILLERGEPLEYTKLRIICNDSISLKESCQIKKYGDNSYSTWTKGSLNPGDILKCKPVPADLPISSVNNMSIFYDEKGGSVLLKTVLF